MKLTWTHISREPIVAVAMTSPMTLHCDSNGFPVLEVKNQPNFDPYPALHASDSFIEMIILVPPAITAITTTKNIYLSFTPMMNAVTFELCSFSL